MRPNCAQPRSTLRNALKSICFGAKEHTPRSGCLPNKRIPCLGVCAPSAVHSWKRTTSCAQLRSIHQKMRTSGTMRACLVCNANARGAYCLCKAHHMCTQGATWVLGAALPWHCTHAPSVTHAQGPAPPGAFTLAPEGACAWPPQALCACPRVLHMSHSPRALRSARVCCNRSTCASCPTIQSPILEILEGAVAFPDL